jgi:hypothetical protein
MGGWRLAKLAGVWLVAIVCGVAHAEFRIDYAEPVTLSIAAPAIDAGGTTDASFVAFGREIELRLESNARITSRLPGAARQKLESYRVYRGELTGLAGSWVRITRVGSDYYGAIWDGHDLYAIEPRTAVVPHLTPGAQAPDGSTLIYRLSDVTNVGSGAFCAVIEPGGTAATKSTTALDAFKSLGAELGSVAQAAATSSLRAQIEIALIGDREFAATNADPEAALLARLNIVDGLFSDQLGITVAASELEVFRIDDDPFAQTNPEGLLTELAGYRESSPLVRDRGVAHLVTGRDLEGSIIGIAYRGSICDPRYGVSLSQSQQMDVVGSALIFAHELGHNFGAPHDNQSGSACASTPSGFLMNPYQNGSSMFSQCSRDQMEPRIAAAQCLVAPQFPDAALVNVPGTTQRVLDQAFDFPLDVLSAGLKTVSNVTFNAIFVGATVQSATVAGGSCAVSSPQVSCTLGNLASGESRQVMLRILGDRVGAVAWNARVNAAVDRNGDNNTASGTINVVPASDGAVRVTPVIVNGLTRSTLEFAADVSVAGVESLRDAFVDFNFNESIMVIDATLAGGSCTVDGSSASCSLGTVPPGEQRRVQVHITSRRAGFTGGVAIVRAANDAITANDRVDFTVDIQASHDVDLALDGIPGRVQIDTPFEMHANLRSLGPEAVSDVRLRLTGTDGMVLDSATLGQVACARDGADLICTIPLVLAGTTLPLTLRAHGREVALSNIITSIESADDDNPFNNSGRFVYDVRVASDVSLPDATRIVAFDGLETSLPLFFSSVGYATTDPITITIALPDNITPLGAKLDSHPDGNACQIADHLVTCTRPGLAPDASDAVTLSVIGPTVSIATGEMRVAAANDADASNNVRPIRVEVLPYVAVAVENPAPPPEVLVGTSFDLPFVITTNRNAAPDVTLELIVRGDVTVESFTAEIGTCSGSAALGQYQCSFGTLPPNSRIHATMRVDPRSRTATYIFGEVKTSNPINFGLPGVHVEFYPQRHGDAAIAVATTLVSATVGDAVQYPMVTVTALETVDDVEVELGVNRALISVDTVTIVEGGICNSFISQAVVRCYLSTLEAGEVRHVMLRGRAQQAGTFISTVRVLATNDTNATNDSRTIGFEVVSAPPPPPPPPPDPTPTPIPTPPSSGGGGGGGFDADLLAALGALAALAHTRRRRRVR